MSTPASAPTRNGTGGPTTGREALTGTQLEMVIAAAHKALTASEVEISPSKISRIVRGFSKHLARSGMTFGVFLENRANQRWMTGDPILYQVIRFCDDPTGEKAVRHAMRQWDPETRTYS